MPLKIQNTMALARNTRQREKRKIADNEIASKVASDNESANGLKKWTEKEKEKVFFCVRVYGHKNLAKIQEELPGKSKDDIRKFLILAHSTARKQSVTSDVTYWLKKSISEMEKNHVPEMNEYYHSAQVIKFLSVDGLLEKHPNPKNCGGIDFGKAYKLIHQALMGYPLQPVNKATADFIIETFNEINNYKNCDLNNELIEFMKKKYEKGENCVSEESAGSISVIEPQRSFYLRKRPVKKDKLLNQVNQPPLKVFIEDGTNMSDNVKRFSLSFSDSKEISTVAVPVASEKQTNELEDVASRLWKNKGFNPLGLKEKWCKMP